MTTTTEENAPEPPLADRIWARQYAQHPGETFTGGAARVAENVAKTPEDAEAYKRMMLERRFIPGGRILAGAGTEHGNLLNCFVQDSTPLPDGSTEGVLHLAKKLALVTKVGGGNGVNLDAIPPKRPYAGPVGRAHVTIDPSHADHDKVRDGTFMDLVTGQYVTKPYQHLAFAARGADLPGAARVLVKDSVEGIWDAAAEMVAALLRGEDVLVDLSELREEGAPVKGSGGNSSGPASFAAEIYDNFARWATLGGAEHAGPVATLRYVYAPTLRVIRQGGTRRGAGMATLSATHPDLLDFITAKDLDREAAEGDISTFNISVLASDEFMTAAARSGTPEAETLDAIAQHAWATGEPGVIFIDTVNSHNPLLKTDGPIMATNPCVTGDTRILTTEGPRAIAELAAAGRDVPVWAMNPKTREITVRLMRHPRKTRAATPIVKVTFDSGLTLRCTPDHHLFTLAGEKVQAQRLKPGDSVLAYGGAPSAKYVPIPTELDAPTAAVNHKVVSVESAGVADVYNGTVDELHTYLVPDELPGGLYAGGIVSANCGEIPLYPAEPCDLGAINVAAFVRTDDQGEPYCDTLGLQETARLAVRFLDDVLDAEKAPLPEIAEAIQDKRRIGLGLMGLADMLIKLGVRYDSEEGRAMARQVVSDLRDAALDESAKLGRERGIPEGVKRAGLKRRNIAVFTVAPTGTTSMLAGVSSGVEPMYAATFVRKIGTEHVTVVQPLLDEILDTLDANAHLANGGSATFVTDDGRWDREKLVAALNEHKGSLTPLLPDLPADARLEAFLTAHDITPEAHVLMQAAIQRAYDWNDDLAWRDRDENGKTLAGNSLSKTINLPHEAEVTDVHAAYRLAWEQGCKGVTVYRDGSRDLQVLTAGDASNSTAATTPTPNTDTPTMTSDTTNAPNAPNTATHPAYERPERMHGFTDQIKLIGPDGEKRSFFVTVNANGDLDPREVFVNSGKGGEEVNADSEALGRVVSIALQWGVPPEAIIKTLRGINGGMYGTYRGRIVHSRADLIAVALESTLEEAKARAGTPAARNGEACPKCGAPTIRTEGCQKCIADDCGWSRCG